MHALDYFFKLVNEVLYRQTSPKFKLNAQDITLSGIKADIVDFSFQQCIESHYEKTAQLNTHEMFCSSCFIERKATFLHGNRIKSFICTWSCSFFSCYRGAVCLSPAVSLTWMQKIEFFLQIISRKSQGCNACMKNDHYWGFSPLSFENALRICLCSDLKGSQWYKESDVFCRNWWRPTWCPHKVNVELDLQQDARFL